VLTTRTQGAILDKGAQKSGCFFVKKGDNQTMAKKGKGARANIQYACTECKQINYTSSKNKKNDPERMEVEKYCPFCKKHTKHKETK
jgi:large subunit ribosomal protein L33